MRPSLIRDTGVYECVSGSGSASHGCLIMRLGAFLLGVALMAAAGVGSRPVSEAARPSSVPLPAPAERIFLSGHSLTDGPYPDHVRHVMATLGRPVTLTERNQSGSTVQARVRRGALAALRDTEGQAPYDTLIITEQHTLLGNLLWSDTLRYLRLVHDELISGNAAGQTILLTSWLGVDDKAAPERWIAYEWAADPVWQCVAGRINDSLAAEGRRDRIHVLPAALALAWLARRGLAEDIPGISDAGRQPRDVMNRLLRDYVHPTSETSYFLALLTHVFLNRTPPFGAWVPADMPPATASALQKLAWRFAASYWARSRPMSADACRNYVGDVFAPLYLAYQRDTQWREDGTVAAYLKWARHRLSWPALFRSRQTNNPFFRDPRTDREYWRVKP